MRPGQLLLLTVLLASACRAHEAPAWEVTPESVGPIRFGVTPPEAAAALGEPLQDSFPAQGCDYWQPRSAPPGVRFMIENGRVVRADLDSQGVATPAGLQVGSSVASVRARYGSTLRVDPHKYEWESGWHYLSLFTADSSHGLVFEADSQVVRKWRAGQWPQVGYVEGCS